MPSLTPSTASVASPEEKVAGKLRSFAVREDGQNLVEFALLLPLLMYILMGMIQFGLVFTSYITINNAVREGARWGSIYIYDVSDGQATNDTTRQDGVLDRIYLSRGILNIPAAGSTNSNFDASGSWTSVATSNCFNQTPTPTLAYDRGDTTICYTLPSDVTDNEARRGYYMEVTAYYHQQIFVPLLDAFFPDDPDKGSSGGQWLRLPGRVTVVIN